MGDDGNPPKEVCMVGWTPQLQKHILADARGASHSP